MSFADLLGSIAGDLVRGRTSSIEYKIRNYMAKSAETAVKSGVAAATAEKKEEDPAEPAPGTPEATAWLLLRAMIAAAASDGVMDDVEREAIMARAEKANLSDAERKKLEAEMESPKTPEELAALAPDELMKEQVYVMSLAAIEVDTDAERAHLQRLAGALGLSDDAVARIESDLGGE